MSTLLNIAVRNASRAPMVTRSEAVVTRECGIEGDYRGRIDRRQVTVLVREAWEAACTQTGADLPWTSRRANLLVEGLDLENSAGSRLHIGDVILEITGETAPCSRMEEVHPDLREALTPVWRGGVTCSVLRGGTLRAGDAARIETGSVEHRATAD